MRSSFGGRRKFMKATTVGLGTLLAGCTGGGDGNQNATEADGGNGDQNATKADGGDGGTTNGDGGDSLSGTTIEYWDVTNIQSQTAREAIEQTISEFESETGATVEVNLSGTEQMSGQEWVQAWQNEAYPAAFNNEDFYFGRIIPTGHLMPFGEYQDDIDDEALDGMQWAMEFKEDAYRFWDIETDPNIINPPFAVGHRNPLSVRTDILEEAGYSLDDIPDNGDAQQDWKEFMQMAQDVQENSGARFGYHGFGAWPDLNDMYIPPMEADEAEGARYISDDGTEAYPGDLWEEWLDRFVGMVHEHGVSGENTASISDEEVATLMYSGDVAMSTVEPLNYPTLNSEAPDVMENGDYQFLPYPAGSSGVRGHIGFHDHGLNRQPSDADEERWNRKLDVGKALMNTLYSVDYQVQYPDMVGWLGIREDAWEETEPTNGEATNFMNAMTTSIEDAQVTWPYHRYSNQIIFRTNAPYLQDALNQQMPADEAWSQARQEANQLIQDANDELGEPGSWPVE